MHVVFLCLGPTLPSRPISGIAFNTLPSLSHLFTLMKFYQKALVKFNLTSEFLFLPLSCGIVLFSHK